jgi:hypothetical protein
MKTLRHGLGWMITTLMVTSCAIPLETVHLPLENQAWKVGAARHLEENEGTVIEYIPEKQTMNDWTRMYMVQFFERWKPTLHLYMTILNRRVLSRCGIDHVTWEVLDEDHNSLLYAWGVHGCEGEPDRHFIDRLLLGRDGLHKISYIEKTRELDPGTRARVLRLIKQAYVAKGGKRVRLAR